MARQLRIEFPGAFYHVMNRGNAGEHVLPADEDKQTFLDCLHRANRRFAIRIHTYCLMDNHYHLLVETPAPNLSQAMQWLNVTYASCYNRRHRRSGHVFQGRFKAILVDIDAYLVVLSRYIHLNPVRAHLVVDPLEYDWSSCREILGQRRVPEWLTTELVLGIFHPERSKAIDLYEKFLAEDNAATMDPQEGAVADFILGRSDFVEGIKRDYLMARSDAAEIPQLRKLKKISPDKIVAAVSETFGESNETIRGKGHKQSMARLVAIGLAREFCWTSGKELGTYFGGVTGAAITMVGKKYERDAAKNPVLQEIIRKVLKQVFNHENGS
ncbi:MAG: transposase [Desulfuromonadales bacterium]|nr:transposase [Desulfuromonadales bacterium]